LIINTISIYLYLIVALTAIAAQTGHWALTKIGSKIRYT